MLYIQRGIEKLEAESNDFSVWITNQKRLAISNSE